MKNTWRYVLATRDHYLETVGECEYAHLFQIIDWLEQSSESEKYQTYMESVETGIKWLCASSSQKKRKYKSDLEACNAMVTGMWLGRLAYETIGILDNRGFLEGGPGYRAMTKYVANLSLDLIEAYGPSTKTLSIVIPEIDGYPDWGDITEEEYDRIDPFINHLN